MSTLLKRDDQQPNICIRGIRNLRYHVEEVLIGSVMFLELLCIWYAMVPLKECLTAALIVAIVVICLGGI